MGGDADLRPQDHDEAWTTTAEASEAPTATGLGQTWEPAERIGRFAVLRLLGEGGMGRVFVGYDERLDRKVAIKLLRTPGGSRASARLTREAQALARLSHPNVVQVHESGVHRDSVFVAMEFIDGETLSDWLRGPTRPWRQIIDVLIQAGRGVEAAHAVGMVHRDFKPLNVIVGSDGRTRVLDFGLARGLDRAGDGANKAGKTMGSASSGTATPGLRSGSESLLDTSLTVSGAVLGTPVYMAPEQHEGRPCDASADLFAFCVSAYEALFAAHPFPQRPLHAMIEAKCAGLIASVPKDTEVPRAIREALRRGLSPAPENRWPDMGSLLSALESARGGHRRWWTPAIFGASLIALVGAGVLTSKTAEDPCERAGAAVEAIWPAKRGEVKDAGLSPVSESQLHARLDLWADRWSAAAHESCEDVHVRHRLSAESLDRRGICLGRRLATVDALVRGLSAGEIRDGPALVEWRDRLEDPRLCLAESVLSSELEAIPAVQAEEVAAVRRSLLSLEFERGGRSLSARIIDTSELVTQAEALAWQPLIGEAALVLGRLHTAIGDGEAARLALGRALDIAEDTRDLEQKLLTWSALNQVERLVTLDVERARWAWQRQSATLKQAESSPRARARLLADQGQTQELAGELVAAENSLREALVLLGGLDPPASWQEATVLRNLGNLLTYTGRAPEARTLFETARDLEIGPQQETRAGNGTPLTTVDQLDEGIAMIIDGEPEIAIAHLRRTLEAARTEHGPRSELVARLHVALAAANSLVGDTEQLRRHAELADTISLEAVGPLHPMRVDVLSTIGQSAIEDERLADATRAFTASLKLSRKITPPESVATAQAELNLGEVLHMGGQDERASSLLAHSLAVLSRSLPADDPMLEEARALLAEVSGAPQLPQRVDI